MARFEINADCGNAPKKVFVRDFNLAFAEENIDFLLERTTDDIVWNMIGGKTITGKAAFTAELEQLKGNPLTKLTLDTILTHGREAAASGRLEQEDGTVYAFADFYVFSGAKGDRIRAITTYMVRC